MRDAPRFDRLARVYRWMEMFTFGPWLERCRCAFLSEMAGCRHAAVLGDGDGRFTAQLLRTNAKVEIDAVDASGTMLHELLRRAGPDAARVHTFCADARAWLLENPPYDLVATHFFLDCFREDEMRAIAAKLHGALSAQGLWVVSEFAIPEGGFGRWVARPVVWLLYRAFGLLTGLRVRTLPDYAATLRGAGFAPVKQRSFLCGLLIAEVWRRKPEWLSVGSSTEMTAGEPEKDKSVPPARYGSRTHYRDSCSRSWLLI
ncbi:MAG: class I SAM-dependent methyltransferase [Terracidiphilus sp.]